MKSNLKAMFLGVIERTQNPMTPTHIADLSHNINTLAPIMAGISSEDEVNRIAEIMCSSMGITRESSIPASPEFIMALMGMLDVSLVGFCVACKPSQETLQ